MDKVRIKKVNPSAVTNEWKAMCLQRTIEFFKSLKAISKDLKNYEVWNEVKWLSILTMDN
jgi:hypothetical protein